jgi:hypothetical protein
VSLPPEGGTVEAKMTLSRWREFVDPLAGWATLLLGGLALKDAWDFLKVRPAR